MKVFFALIVVVALLAPCAAQAASFLDSVNQAEAWSYSVPADFPGLLVPQPRRKPAPSAMVLACLGLIIYLGSRRAKALAV